MPKDKSQADKAALTDCYKRVFGSPDGKTVLKDLKKHFFIDKTPFVPGDPQGTHFNLGLQMAFTHIINRQKKSILPILQEEED